MFIEAVMRCNSRELGNKETKASNSEHLALGKTQPNWFGFRGERQG